ncbi:MAG: YqjD family protein [Limisphaerales bacterium]
METRAKNLTREAQETIKEKAQQWGDRAKAASNVAMEKAHAAYDMAHDRTIAGARATDQAIRENPYIALGIAFGCGLAIGLLARSNK